MYKLFAYPNSYAMSAHAILEETGAPYDVHWVQIFTDSPDPAFLVASPHARVPALQTEEETIFETGAIALYLAEEHPESDLLIRENMPGRATFLQWLHYLASTLQPDVIIQFHPELYFPDDEDAQKCLLLASMGRLSSVMDVIENTLAVGPYFCGEKRTILDYLFVMQAIWPEIFPTSAADYPNIDRLIKTLLERPAVTRAYGQHIQEQRAPIKADGSPAPDGYGLHKET
ncbi:MAG: glutathione S-transferase family protein [Rhodospirillales bacterium]|jgi:glutathione S-transferase|nr:glutathione S-transferase family protein [Rhodospirillales bacterium]